MIAYIKGRVLSVYDNTAIIEVGGIGYEIICSATAISKLYGAAEGEVFTYLSVREDGVSLFGFDNQAEKQMFLKLITVNGVGPKMGMTVLSGMSLNDLAMAIASSDVKGLSRIKGLGKKTAERIILELRESLADIPAEGAPQKAVKLSDDGENAVFGSPVIEGATVTANVVKNGKSAKVRVYKMKPKKGYRRTQGHRQPYTKVQIETINA